MNRKSMPPSKLASADLRSIVNDVLVRSKPLSDKKSIKLRNSVDKRLHPVLLNVDNLKDTLFNLIAKAIAVCKSGEITVSVESKDRSSLIRVTNGSDYGITIQLLPMLNSHHEFTDIEVKIDIQDSTKKQKKQNINLPKQPQLRVIDNEKKNRRRDPNGHHILIVDANAVKRMIIQCYLSDSNYRVSQVAGGYEAISLMRKSRNIDIVIMGMCIKEMSVAQLCQNIRSIYSRHELSVICFMDAIRLDKIEYFFDIGGNDVITKNDSKEELISKINTQINVLEYYRSLKLKGLAESLIEFR